jgi:uroporphyrin-III C-methyltransferase
MKTPTHAPASARGQVSLVGAGPGDPDLLTLKAVKTIAAATVILVDDLVNEAVLAHATPNARIVHVGKRGGCASTPQAFIEKLMVSEAQKGENVVRLKGGDPLVFGRSGEEIEALQKAGITVQVVNGITAALGALASLNTALTHRDHAHGVLMVTGHAKPGDPGTDWRALAHTARQAKLTLVVYMGVAAAQRIQNELLHGLPADTPVAIVQDATLPSQRQALCTLDCLHQTLTAQRMASPCILVIGDVLRGLASLGHTREAVLARGRIRAM